MSRKPKYSFDVKVKACEDYINGERSLQQIAQDLGLKSVNGSMRYWISSYREHGPDGLLPAIKNPVYTKSFKLKVVKEYIDGKGSIYSLAGKYGIKSVATLNRWILRYNSDMELKDYDPKQEVYMAKSRRSTTISERKEIVEYCIMHNLDYKVTAEKYAVSYSQVYSWVKKYYADGEKGLTDKRGRHKSDEEVDELEKLRRENKRLKRQLEERDMTVELLKKVKEFERRRF
ncbi:helix-turn-helix domain-containing protein [Clostridium tyrobutyricum]|jgi:transposase-like protein|uniref:helix-turn-helix domain-containing protein n=1 Tax=Clostridium tyrobutyricum TaxID=1519 RepID=UPI00073D762E|nr:helix-turn-helix domain-containing protein [Clostridium tyrobutyricum]